ncbi:MAG: elongation factor P [Planctomycetota bacterium]|nr:elongation factor P [Planctomycetota bacterium]
MQATNLRPGQGIKLDGKLFVVTGIEHRTPGNLRAFIQLKIKDVIKAQTLERRFKPSDDLEVIDLDRRPMEYLYSDNTGATFMDAENYEQMTISKEVLGDALLYMRPNSSAIVLMHDGNPILIELPPSVELVVKDCDPGVKNATVTSVMKEATMETGLKTRVPDFINQGETLRISTADGAYQSRA